MNKIKSYINFINESVFRAGKSLPRTRKQVEEVIKWYKVSLGNTQLINYDLSVDVAGNVVLDKLDLEFIPLKFGIVSDGNFSIYDNKLKNLIGSPDTVDEFNCKGNELTSLEGAPEIVFNFNCDNNQLLNLIGAPKKIYGDFNASYNPLTSLEGLPDIIKGELNIQITRVPDLSTAPKEIWGDLTCSHNQYLKNLNASHIKLDGDFYCTGTNISNLIGLPQMSDRKEILISQNEKLTSLEGLPVKFNLIKLTNDKKFSDYKKTIKLCYDWLDVILSENESLIEINLEWLKLYKEYMPVEFEAKYGHWLEFQHYTKIYKEK